MERGKVLVADIMTRYPITANPETNLLECSKKMVRKRVGSLLLVKSKKLVGIICYEDILWALIKKTQSELAKIKAIDISPKKIATIKPNVTVGECLKKMKKLKFERLPVIHEGELVGLVTVKDILSFNPEFYTEFKEIEEIREESVKLKRIKKAKTRDFIHEGVCEECGKNDILYKVDGRLICESCNELM